MKNPSGQTKILTTHALCFLPHVDYIYTIADGRITKCGTFPEFMAREDIFSTSLRGPGARREEEMADEVADGVEVGKTVGDKRVDEEDRRTVSAIQDKNEGVNAGAHGEKINIGSVAWSVYKEYILAGNGHLLVPALLFLLLLVQGTQVMSQYWLVFWHDAQFHRPAGFYVRVLSLLSYGGSF